MPPNELYGRDWQDYKDRYWSSPFTRKRCFWHRGRMSFGGRQLNHLSYARQSTPRWWQVKPMCRTCHKIETFLARALRALGVKKHPHYVATYGVRWLINLTVTAPIWYPLVFVFHVIP